MEHRSGKIIISSAGGTAARGSKTYKVSIPSLWIKEMGIDENNRNVDISFDGKTIYISRELSAEDFALQKKSLGHDVRIMNYYDDKELCTVIYADFSDETLKAENHTSDIVKTAFGNNKLPTWADFKAFLEDRCIPRSRGGIREYLEAIEVADYNPLEIIKKTKGRMAEDRQWIEIKRI